MRIALAVGAANPELSTSDKLLAQALAAEGCDVEVLRWNVDPVAAFTHCDAVVLRATWDYQDDLPRFERWARAVEEEGGSLFNSAAVATWNNDKRHVLGFLADGLPVPQTLDLDRWEGTYEEAAAALGGNVVIKPAWGGDGIGVQRVMTQSVCRAVAILRAELPGRPVLMQAYLPEIEAGEWSLVFIAGRFAHAVRKQPAAGDFRVNSRFGGRRAAAIPPDAAIAAAKRILRTIEPALLYARVDGVMVRDGFMCIEVELTDPNLYLDLVPKTARLLAKETIRCSLR